MRNPCAKTRPQDAPYEIWTAPGFEWRVLKKYQSPEAEAKNPHARWFLATSGPGTFGSFELGDGYAKDVKAYGTLVYRDPAIEAQPPGQSSLDYDGEEDREARARHGRQS